MFNETLQTIVKNEKIYIIFCLEYIKNYKEDSIKFLIKNNFWTNALNSLVKTFFFQYVREYIEIILLELVNK